MMKKGRNRASLSSAAAIQSLSCTVTKKIVYQRQCRNALCHFFSATVYSPTFFRRRTFRWAMCFYLFFTQLKIQACLQKLMLT